MPSRRTFIALCAAGLLSACAGAPPTESVLDTATRSSLRIVEVDVDVSAMGPQTKGRIVPASNVKASVSEASNGLLRGKGKGPRAARAEIAISDVSIITAGQSIVIGGESLMQGTLRVVDARTGQQIVPPTEIVSGGGGWVAGGLIAAATRDDAYTEVRQMSLEFASRAQVLLFGNSAAPTAAKKTAAPAEEPEENLVPAHSDPERDKENARCRSAITEHCKV